MAAYKDLIGQKITKTTSDPSEAKTGQMWYNSTTGNLRGLGIVEAFISSAPLSTKREGAGAFGTQTAGVICGGETPSVSGATEEYNGTGFSAGGTMNTARYRLQGTAGTATAGIIFGGVEPATSNKTETYNGTAWTTSPYTLNTARWCAGAGIQTSALAFGGGPSYKNNTEEFDGEGWTAGNTLNTARNSLSGAGANAEECLAFGGETSSPPAVATNATESWDGTSWTEVNNLNTARYGGYGAGTQTAAILIGGIVGPGTMQSATEIWDGTNWTTSPASLATARGRLSVAGSSTAAIAMAGQTPSITTATEEYNKSSNTLTAAAWSSAANMPYVVQRAGAAGTVDAAFVFGGHRGPSDSAIGPPTDTPTTNTCLGAASIASWTNGPALNTGRSSMGSWGTQTAAMCVGGDPYRNESETYNGSSWTEGPNLPAGRQECAGCGTTSAALLAGGSVPPFTGTSFEYDGSNWTAGGTNPAVMTNTGAVGSVTAALVAAGYVGPPPSTAYSSATYHYDGSSWTTGGNLVLGNGFMRLSGVQTAAIMMNGSTPTDSAANLKTQQYDGTNWVTGATRSQDNSNRASSGTAPAAGTFSAGGYHNPSPGSGYLSEVVEEYVGETSTVKVDTFQTS